MISVNNTITAIIIGMALTAGLEARKIFFTFASTSKQVTRCSIDALLTRGKKVECWGVESFISNECMECYTFNATDTLECILRVAQTAPDAIESVFFYNNDKMSLPSTDIIIPAGDGNCNIAITIDMHPYDAKKSQARIAIQSCDTIAGITEEIYSNYIEDRYSSDNTTTSDF